MKNVTLHNSDVDDIFLSVVDLNQPGEPQVLPVTRLNRDKKINIQVQEDGDDHVRYRWAAQRTDDETKTAEHESTETSQDVTTFFG